VVGWFLGLGKCRSLSARQWDIKRIRAFGIIGMCVVLVTRSWLPRDK